MNKKKKEKSTNINMHASKQIVKKETIKRNAFFLIRFNQKPETHKLIVILTVENKISCLLDAIIRLA